MAHVVTWLRIRKGRDISASNSQTFHEVSLHVFLQTPDNLLYSRLEEAAGPMPDTGD